MIKFDASQIQWRLPWSAISHDYASNAEVEIYREMSAGHILFGRSVKAVGCRQDCDDVLFHLGDSAPSFAVVHLSYQQETRTEWPTTRLFDSLVDWMERCMIPDAEHWAL